MSVVAFDTHKFAKRLREAGFTQPQAEAVTQAVQEAASIDLTALATKQDLAEVQRDIAELRQATKTDIAELRQTSKSDVREAELRLEAKIAETKADLLKTIVGAVVFNSAVVLAGMFGLAKLLGH